MPTYFNSGFTDFFKSLSKNNSTSWFNDNRKTYEKEVKKPFSDFVEEMIKRIKKYEPKISVKAADCIMRINKDIRFSKDKTPYNTHMAANISEYGKKDKSYPGFYFQFSPEKVLVVGGSYSLEPDKLQKIRSFIAANPKKFAAAYSDTKFKEKFGEIQGEKNKRLDDVFQKVVDKEPLIANKQFYYQAELKPGILKDADLPETLMQYYQAGKKVNDFLKEALAS